MKLFVVTNPKVKANIQSWVEKEREEESNQCVITRIENIGKLFTYMNDVKEDFLLDENKLYTVLGLGKHLFLMEMPMEPMEIFDYVKNNPDNLSNFSMQIVMPALKVFLNQMFDINEKRYE